MNLTMVTIYIDFADRDAFFLAQISNQSLLEPPKDLYEKIHKDLDMIRKAYPVLKHIRVVPDMEPGKIICNEGIDLNKLNSSEFGPIKVEGIGHKERLITFNKPYNSNQLLYILVNDYGIPKAQYKSCGSVERIGGRTQITRIDFEIFDEPDKFEYMFTEGSVDCFVKCRRSHKWFININKGKISMQGTIIRELGERHGEKNITM